MTQLKKTFIELIKLYSNDLNMAEAMWAEIEGLYASKGRYYHTLQHLAHLLIQLSKVKQNIQDWDILLFTLYYHDIVYVATRTDNEEQSADLAVLRLKKLAIPSSKIIACKSQILATKSHLKSGNMDTNYFTDADLSILGEDWKTYSLYFENVRKEYAMYSDKDYREGRKKVLQHFLNMENIFKTNYFNQKLETRAKENLKKELHFL